jgi:hypothetical protein
VRIRQIKGLDWDVFPSTARDGAYKADFQFYVKSVMLFGDFDHAAKANCQEGLHYKYIASSQHLRSKLGVIVLTSCID